MVQRTCVWPSPCGFGVQRRRAKVSPTGSVLTALVAVAQRSRHI